MREIKGIAYSYKKLSEKKFSHLYPAVLQLLNYSKPFTLLLSIEFSVSIARKKKSQKQMTSSLFLSAGCQFPFRKAIFLSSVRVFFSHFQNPARWHLL